ncbi:MAG: hypothetical protein IJ572_01470 [Bacilli bacterium]|nr:hypothetical protein [Bacilli bacterium]
MESGTFNHNKKIFNLIIKYSKDLGLSKLILEEMSSKSAKEYMKDINDCGVKTANVLSEFSINKTNIIIENYISGMTIDQILKNNSPEKLTALKQLFIIYKKISNNENLCLDWNLKNFIYHNNELYYIDFVPSIYKDKIRCSKEEILKDYIDTYLDSNVTLLGIYYYILKTLSNAVNKEELLLFSYELDNLFKEELNIKLDFNSQHEYGKCIKIMREYLNSNFSFKQLEEQLKKVSLEEKVNEDYKKKYVLHM